MAAEPYDKLPDEMKGFDKELNPNCSSPLVEKRISKVRILPGFWHDRQAVNAEAAIFHQWEQLEASGCIENFRIAAGELEGFREGWFFADSDAFKWLDAAARVYATHPDPQLESLMDEFIDLIGRAQQPDGYLYTYNQIHFPDVRWGLRLIPGSRIRKVTISAGLLCTLRPVKWRRWATYI